MSSWLTICLQCLFVFIITSGLLFYGWHYVEIQSKKELVKTQEKLKQEREEWIEKEKQKRAKKRKTEWYQQSKIKNNI